jgi:teichuronic acid exporter
VTKKKQYYGRTAKLGALWSVIRQGGSELIALPTTMIMARLLTPEEFGVTAAATFFIVLAARLTQFGLNASIVRVKELRPEHESSVFVVNIAIGVVTYLAMFAAAPAIGHFFHSELAGQLLPVAALSFIINAFGTVPAALIQRRMQFRYSTLADWSDALLGCVIQLTLAFAGWGVWSIVYGQLAGALVRVVLKIHLSQWRPRFYWSRSALRELLSFGLGVQSKRLLEYAALNLDNLVVGRLLGMASLGFYDKAFGTANRLVNRLTLGGAYFRIFAIIHDDQERFRRAYAKLLLTVTLIGFPIFAACAVTAPQLIVVLYGEKWRPAIVPFQLLCLGGMLKLLNAYAAQANEAMGNIWRQVRWQAASAIVLIGGVWLGTVSFGIAGAALGVLASVVLFTIATQNLVREGAGLAWRDVLAPQIPGLTCAGLMILLLAAVELTAHTLQPAVKPWQLLLAQGAAGVLFYAAFVLLSPFAGVRMLVAETITDLPPRVGRRLEVLAWRGRPA